MIFSASSVNEFELCPRKWGWHKIENIPCPSGPSARLGNDIHEFLQGVVDAPDTFLDPGSGNPYMGLTSPGRSLWPNFVGAKTEQEFRIKLGGFDFIGYIDLTWHGGDGPSVLDHKTTGNFKYVKQPADLVKDTQATLYVPGAHAVWGTNPTDPVNLYWIYYHTKQPYKGHKSTARVAVKDVAERLDKTIASAALMTEALNRNKRAVDLEPNWNSCNAFGQPCPYKSRCYLEENMGKADDILNRLKTQGEGKTDPPAVQPVNPPMKQLDIVQTTIMPARTVMNSLSESLDTPEVKTDPPVAAAPEEKPTAAKPKGRKKTTLYIDAVPTKGGKQPVDASEYIERAAAMLSSPHYKLEDYGKGAGLFAVALRNLIEADGLAEAVYLSLGTTEGRDACQVFVSFSDTVIRGMPR